MVGEEGEASAAAAPAAAVKAAPQLVARRGRTAVVQAAPGTKLPPVQRHPAVPLRWPAGLRTESGLDIRQIRGTGPGGAVVMKDVEAFRQTGQGAATVSEFPLCLVTPQQVGGGQGFKSLQQGVGDPVLFIHGFGADLSSWRPFVMQMNVGNPLAGA